MHVHVYDSIFNHFSIKSLINCMPKMAQAIMQKECMNYISKDATHSILGDQNKINALQQPYFQRADKTKIYLFTLLA